MQHLAVQPALLGFLDCKLYKVVSYEGKAHGDLNLHLSFFFLNNLFSSYTGLLNYTYYS